MKISKNSLILTAAFTGLLGGTAARATASPTQDAAKPDTMKATKVEKHACAGKGSCTGQGGCATDGSVKNKAAAAKITVKHACAGKNACSGQGGCATDGSVKNAYKAK